MSLPKIPGKEAADHADINCDLLRIVADNMGLNPRGLQTTTQYCLDEMTQEGPYFYDVGIEAKGSDIEGLKEILAESASSLACHSGLKVRYEDAGNLGFKVSSEVVESHELSVQLLNTILGTSFSGQIIVEDPVLRERTFHSDINLGVLKVALQQNGIDPMVIKSSAIPLEEAPWYRSGIAVDFFAPHGPKAINYLNTAFVEMDKGWDILSGMDNRFHGPAFETHDMTKAALTEILKPIFKRHPVRSLDDEVQSTGTSQPHL